MTAIEQEMSFLSMQKDGSIGLLIYVQPRATKSGLAGIYDGCLKLAISSPPVDNKANRAVVSFLASLLTIPQKNISLASGEKSRRKLFCIAGMDIAEVQKRIRLNLSKG